MKQGEVWTGRREGGRRGGGASRMQGRARLEIRGEGTHIKHAVHGCDAGRVEAQRLVERARAVEHVGHGCDAGRVEAQWLVERHRVLPSRKDGT